MDMARVWTVESNRRTAQIRPNIKTFYQSQDFKGDIGCSKTRMGFSIKSKLKQCKITVDLSIMRMMHDS